MKKKLIIVVCLVLIFLGLGIFGGIKLYSYLRIKNAKIEVVLEDDLNIKFNTDAKVSDKIISINGKLLNDYTIDTTKIGPQTLKFDFINDDGVKVSYEYNIEVIDDVPPVIWVSGSYSVKKGSKDSFIDRILCGDNYDSSPDCFIEGEYDLNTVGTYEVVFKAVDSSGNITEEPIKLNVYEPQPSSSNSTTSKPKLKISDVIAKHKNEDTKIGIDVSSWQGDIDFKKVKEAGVEFVIIRVGGTRGTRGEYFVDSKFKQNIEGAKANGLEVGLYFYSYADSDEHAKKDAEWLIEQIKDYDIDLPIAFDWEEWSSFNEYSLSFYELSKMSDVFLGTLEQSGYKGMLYSSKNYLEYIWFPTKYDTWLAHYTNETNYKGDYIMWQMSSSGKVDGIKGNVDIDVMYLKR